MVQKTRGQKMNKNKATTRRRQKHIFTTEHYQSREGFLTSIWGPALWHFLHTTSFNYPPEPTLAQKKQYMNFIHSLQHVLPCKYCRINFEKNMKTLPLTMREMENRETFSRYIYNLHELINQMLKKRSNLTYEDVRDRYEHFRANGCSKAEKAEKAEKADLLVTKTKKEKGCVKPMHGTKAKCVIKIVPQNKKCETFQMDKSVSKG